MPLPSRLQSESDCSFTFDFRQVYWNSRLHAEHQRLVQSFAPYDVLSDVMAGVGPFALPAAKKGLWVLANDLNPASYESLVGNMKANKVEPRIRASCEDGRAFIRSSILRAWEEAFEGPPLRPEEDDAVKSATQLAKEKRAQRSSRPAASSSQAQAPAKTKRATIERLPPRRLVDHFVMNLPASALEFLDAYRGAYLPLRDAVGAEVLEAELDAREKEGKARWPMVHVHCFTKDLAGAHEDVCHVSLISSFCMPLFLNIAPNSAQTQS
jgi:tRNA (guanine37-N1)-methyltransferase